MTRKWIDISNRCLPWSVCHLTFRWHMSEYINLMTHECQLKTPNQWTWCLTREWLSPDLAMTQLYKKPHDTRMPTSYNQPMLWLTRECISPTTQQTTYTWPRWPWWCPPPDVRKCGRCRHPSHPARRCRWSGPSRRSVWTAPGTCKIQRRFESISVTTLVHSSWGDPVWLSGS